MSWILRHPAFSFLQAPYVCRGKIENAPWKTCAVSLREAEGRAGRLFQLSVLAAVPDHAGLLLGTEPQLFVEARPAGAEPEEFDFLQARMMENALDDLGSDALLLIGLVDNDIPNSRAIDEIREHSAEADQAIAIPRTQRHIGMAKHLAGIIQRPALGPRCLLKQRQ